MFCRPNLRQHGFIGADSRHICLAVLHLSLACTAQATREADTMQERLEGQAKKGDSTANDLISGGGTGNGTSDVRSINQV